MQATRDAVTRVCGGGSVSCRFTHVYPDGPAPYYTVLAPGRRGSELEQWDEIKAAASEALLAAGGTITHHHAVGRDHRPWYDRQRPDLFARGAARRQARARSRRRPEPRRAGRHRLVYLRADDAHQRELPQAPGRLPVPRDRPPRARVPGAESRARRSSGSGSATSRCRWRRRWSRRCATPSTRWARAPGFHGYAPDQGYDFLLDAILEHDYRARGVALDADEIFVSDGSKQDSGNIQEIFGAGLPRSRSPIPSTPSTSTPT